MTYKESMQLEESIYDFVKTVLNDHEKVTGRPVQVDIENNMRISIAIDNLFYTLRDCMK